MPTSKIQGTPLPPWKRAMDVMGAFLGLLFLAPLLLLVALYIRIVSSGSPIFKQERIGFEGKPFILWKFRSMHANSDEDLHRAYLQHLILSQSEDAEELPMLKIMDDPRIIPLGNLLRKTAMDELPQLFNVLFGEMSLVGPRPAIDYEVAEYQEWELQRFKTMPGLTGLWQVSGKNDLTFTQMVRLDIEYAETLSPWLDMKILFRTLPTLVWETLRKTKGRRAGHVKGA
jgi:lipopolysaccharide/colanic/teichoic acid biosynthesis glycosyltransferase